MADSDIKDDALGLEVTTLEEIVKAVEEVGLATHVRARTMVKLKKIGCRGAPTGTNHVQNVS